MSRTITTDPAPGQLTPGQREAARSVLRRFTDESLSPAELAVEIERWEHHRALLVGDLNAQDFTSNDRDTLQAGITYADQRLAQLEYQAKRVLRAGRTAKTPNLKPDFDRARDVNLAELVETLTSQPVRRHGNRHVTACPFHTGDRSPSLTIYGPGRGWHCFGCGRGGQDAASFCAEFFGCSQLEGLRWVEQLCGLRAA